MLLNRQPSASPRAADSSFSRTTDPTTPSRRFDPTTPRQPLGPKTPRRPLDATTPRRHLSSSPKQNMDSPFRSETSDALEQAELFASKYDQPFRRSLLSPDRAICRVLDAAFSFSALETGTRSHLMTNSFSIVTGDSGLSSTSHLHASTRPDRHAACVLAMCSCFPSLGLVVAADLLTTKRQSKGQYRAHVACQTYDADFVDIKCR